MKPSHIVSLFITVFLIIFGISYFTTHKTGRYEDYNRQAGVELTNACVDAMKDLDTTQVYVWSDEGVRAKAIVSFYRSLSKSQNKDLYMDDLFAEQTPFVMLVDNNGYYLYHNIAFDNFSLVTDTDVISSMTGLNTFSEALGGNVVQYYLNGKAKVITSANNVIEGAYDDLKHLGLWTNKTEYDNRRNTCIVRTMEKAINNQINGSNTGITRNLQGYNVTLPVVAGEDWHRLIDEPCVISFLQGSTSNGLSGTLNAFAYAGGEEVEQKLFKAQNGLYYPTDIKSSSSKNVTENGSSITVSDTSIRNFGTMFELARQKNNPHVSAYSDNFPDR